MQNNHKLLAAKLILCHFIVERMNELGTTQVQLSELTGINQSNLSKILSGKGNPTLDNFLKICEVLKIRLFLETKEENQSINLAKDLLNKIERDPGIINDN